MLIPSMLKKEHRDRWEQSNQKHRKIFLEKLYAQIESNEPIEYNSRVVRCRSDDCHK